MVEDLYRYLVHMHALFEFIDLLLHNKACLQDSVSRVFFFFFFTNLLVFTQIISPDLLIQCDGCAMITGHLQI